jgi:UDP-glucose 4-epimerase
MTVLITGANGFLGKHLETYLHQQGYPLVALLRQGRRAAFASTQCHFFSNFNAVDYNAVLRQVDTVVHCAAMVHQPKQQDLSAYMRINCDATCELARAAIAQGVKKFIVISTSHVYEGAAGPYDESCTPKPQSPYAQSKYEATQQLLALFQTTDTKLYIIRPPLIYGKGVKGNLAALSHFIKKMPWVPFYYARAKRSYISVTNLCGFVQHLIDGNHSPGIYNVSDNDDQSTWQLCQMIAAAQRRRMYPLPVPGWFMKVLFSILGRADHHTKIFNAFRLNIDKALATGWQPKPMSEKEFSW